MNEGLGEADGSITESTLSGMLLKERLRRKREWLTVTKRSESPRIRFSWKLVGIGRGTRCLAVSRVVLFLSYLLCGGSSTYVADCRAVGGRGGYTFD